MKEVTNSTRFPRTLVLFVSVLFFVAGAQTLWAQSPEVFVNLVTPDSSSSGHPTSLKSTGRWGVADGLFGSGTNPIPVQEDSGVLVLIGSTQHPGIPPGDQQLDSTLDPFTKSVAPGVAVQLFGQRTSRPAGNVVAWENWQLNSPRPVVLEVTILEGSTNPPFDSAKHRIVVELWFARTQANRNPTANAGSDTAVSFGDLVTLNGSGNDPDDDPLSFSWVQLASTAAQVALIGETTKNPTFTAPSQVATLEFELTVNDGKGGVAKDTVKVFVTASGGGDPPPDGESETVCPAEELNADPPNVPATGSVTQGLVVVEGSPVFLVANGDDPDDSTSGNIPVAGVGFSWEVVAGKGILTTANLSVESEDGTSQATFTAPQVGVDTIVTIAVEIKDPRSCGTRITTNVKIQDVDGGGGPGNVAPTVQIGTDFQVSKGEKVELPGSADDPDGDLLTLLWTQVSGPAVVLSSTTSATTSFTVPLESDTGAIIGLRLTANDGKGGQASDEISMEVLANRVPKVSVQSSQLVNSGASAALVATGQDDDGDTLTYSWTQIDGPAVELEDAGTSEASFAAPTVTQEQGLISLNFRIEVNDGLATTAANHRVDVKFLVLNSVYFPSTVEGFDPMFAGTFVGIAVHNPNTNSNDIGLTALAGDGAEVEQGQGQALNAVGQKAFLSGEVVSESGLSDARLIRARGNAGPVQGFFLIGDGSSRLDGVGGGEVEAKTLYFSIAREGADRTTLYYVINPNEDASANVTVRLFDVEGNEVASVSNEIPALGAAAGTLQQFFFPSNPDVDIEDGYVKVTSDVVVRGFAIGATEDDYESIGGQVPIQTKTMVVPHFFVDAGSGDTVIRLFNADPTATVTAKIKGFGDDSNQIGEEGTFQVGPGELVSVSLKEALNIDTGSLLPGQIITGFARLEMTAAAVVFQKTPLVIGSLTFTGNNGAFRSTLPLVRNGRVETLFLHVAQEPAISFFTGLGILNPSTSKTANVIVEVYDEAGQLTGSNAFQIEPGRRVVDLLDGPMFFSQGFAQLEGHFRVISDVEVIAIALFGNFDSTLMSAIEGQAPIQ